MERDKDEIDYVKKVLYDKTRRHVKRIAKIKDDIQLLGTNRFDKDTQKYYQPNY